MGHDHSHIHTSSSKRLGIAICLTGGFLIAEVAGGILTGSLALLSDAAHMMTDVMALAIALMAVRVGARRADAKRTFGYRRLEILAAALNAAALLLVAFYILYAAWWRFQNPPDIASTGMLVIAIFGLIINLLSMRVLSGNKESLNIRAAYTEVFADMISSLGVIGGAIIIKLTGWSQVDPILAALIGLWVLPRSWRLLGESLNILLEGVPAGIDMKKLYTELTAIPGVCEVHDLHVWAITTGQNSLTAQLIAADYPTDETIMKAARNIANGHGIAHTNFQIEVTGWHAPCALDSHHHTH